jgi:aminopeptidase N
MMTRVSTVVVAVMLMAAPAAAQRLPDTAVPEHYTLWFAPDLDKETFRGRSTIQAVVTGPTSSITLHAAELEFAEVRITSGGRTQTARVTVDAKAETATFTVPTRLAEGPVTIEASYTGILNDKLRGFYISQANGRKYAVTQMEPTDARRAFPSFDEPSFKATFDVSMTVATGDMAISNGRVVSDMPGPEPGTHTITYARTPKMSTYLVAMIVGDFTCREGRSDATPVRICATPDKQGLTAFALEAAEHQLKFFNEYFGIDYPFGKLDIVAIPDFAAGAMENAGAITFRERLLLVDPDRSSVNTRKTVAAVIAHEIAHQWFGNLVTMKWWDDIWLNEGFASWITSKPLADWRPEWRVELDDAQETQSALATDALQSTRAIRTHVETNEQINEVFDAIAYDKTSAVLRMIEAYVGPQAFRKAITSYLMKFSYSNAAGEDFWTEVARVTGRPVDRIMRSYVEQPGAPVLTIRSSCVAGSSEIAIAQSRFVGSPGASAPTQTWAVPACFKSGDGAPRCELITARTQRAAASGCEGLFANADARGYYFSEYTPMAIRELGRAASALEPVERLSLLGDEWWMVRAGRHDIDSFLDLSAILAADTTPAVVATIAARLTQVAQAIADVNQQALFERWIRDRFAAALAGIGIPGDARDSDDLQARRATLLMLVGVAGNDAGVQRRARELAALYIADPTSLPPSLAGTVLQVAAASGDRALYDQYVGQLAKLAAQPEEYYRFFNALAWFREPALVQATLTFALSPAVRTQDTGSLLAALLSRPWARDAAWDFTKSRWNSLVERLGMFQGIPEVIGGLGSMCSASAAGDIKAFFASHPVPAAQRGLQRSIERVESCAALDARQSPPFAAWLATAAR